MVVTDHSDGMSTGCGAGETGTKEMPGWQLETPVQPAALYVGASEPSSRVHDG